MRLSKLLLLVFLALQILGCTQDYKSGKELIDIAINGLPDSHLTEEERLSLGFAAIYVKYGQHPKTYIALAKAIKDERIWAASDGITIVTRYGQIVRTDGLPFSSSGVYFTQENPFEIGLLSVSQDTVYSAKRDFISEGMFGVTSHSRFSIEESSSHFVAGKERQLQKVTEYIHIPDLEFQAENHYWVEQNNNKQIVWRSEQQLGPAQPRLLLESLLPYFDDI
ncbi:YjbF family lipoprotein [Agarivorans aestuarii]|uniref:YjbF family lipoprotein n=1 Tax=Agarivorans aestuarii TaxID=1563703 RepID=UPI001C80E5B6|nr:YjbF family lipoprotein [Agarivorans aestuarii]